MKKHKPRISVIGLGKLGACTAACIASKGFDVIGVDVNPKVIQRVNRGLPPVQETGLFALMKKSRGHLTATLETREAVLNSDITLVIVPTPSDRRGAFSLQYVQAAGREIGAALKEKKSYHLVVLVSTVLPGSTEFGLKAILEKLSGKRCGRDFGLCYNPEFIALGSVIRDFQNPDFVLIGESDKKAGDLLSLLYKNVCNNTLAISRMNFVSAELAKISLNTFITTKISFANMLGEVCERLPGADVDAVTSAIGLDKRVGAKFFRSGLGYGGTCFPRDNRAFGFMARQLGTAALLGEATDRMNNQFMKHLTSLAIKKARRDRPVAVLGLSFKPGTNVIEESPALAMAFELSRKGFEVIAHDPLALENVRRAFPLRAFPKMTCCGNLGEVLNRSGTLIFTNPDPAYRTLTARDFKKGAMPKLVIDCWRLFRGVLRDDSLLQYVPVGIGRADSSVSRCLQRLWTV